MYRIVALSGVLSLACAFSAAAQPPAPTAPRPPPPAATCTPGGAVLFEIDHRVEPGAKLATSAVKLYTSGAWTHDEADADGKPQPRTSGCLPVPEVRQLASVLHGAPWKITTARIHCMAISSSFTEYRVDGKLVFTQKLCSGQSLDDKSHAALDKAIAAVEPPGTARPAP